MALESASADSIFECEPMTPPHTNALRRDYEITLELSVSRSPAYIHAIARTLGRDFAKSSPWLIVKVEITVSMLGHARESARNVDSRLPGSELGFLHVIVIVLTALDADIRSSGVRIHSE